MESSSNMGADEEWITSLFDIVDSLYSVTTTPIAESVSVRIQSQLRPEVTTTPHLLLRV